MDWLRDITVLARPLTAAAVIVGVLGFVAHPGPSDAIALLLVVALTCVLAELAFTYFG